MVKQTTINCPGCGLPVALEASPDKPDFLVAYCDCGRGVKRAVYETPAVKPAVKEAEK